MPTRVNTEPVKLRQDGDGPSVIYGTGVVAYDGTPRTEYVMREGNKESGVRRVVERIMPGAGDAVLSSGKDIYVSRNHNPDNILGRTTAGTAKVWKDPHTGDIKYEATAPDTTAGRDTVAQLARGDLQGSSFMFWPEKENHRMQDGIGVIEIHEFRVMPEMGPVTSPAYKATDAAVRSGNDELLKRFEEFEKVEDAKVAKLEQEDAAATEAKRAEYEERARKAGA